MKKIYTLIFAALCAATVVSCNKEIATEDTPQQEEVAPVEQTLLNPVTLTFYAEPETKIAIDGDGKASWEDGDKIQIVSFDAEGTAKYVKDIVVEIIDGKGKFTAIVEDSEIYYAVYPSSATVKLEKVGEEDNLKVTIADKQDGTFKNACYYAAKTSKAAKEFNFKAISGILKFQADSDYKLANIRDVEKTAVRHALAETEICTFDAEGNVSVAPASNISSLITLTLNGNGTYYAAVCGNAVNEVCFRFSKDAAEETATYEPGVYYNNLVTFAPAWIKNYGKLTEKIVTDVYVAPTKQGTGDGLSAANAAPASDLVEACLGNADVKYTAVKGLFKYTGVWNCFRMDGLTINFADGDYTDAFTVAGNNSAFILTLKGSAGAIMKGGLNLNANYKDKTLTKIEGLTFTSTSATALTVTNGKCELKNCKFTGCSKALYVKKNCALENCTFTDNNATSGNGTALILDITAQVTAKKCTFSGNKGTNGAAVCVNNGTAASDDFVILSAEDCIFQNNSVSGSGGAILIAQSAYKGQIRFNNCRFDGNQATGTSSHAAVFYCNCSSAKTDATAALFNGCTFVNSKSFANTGTTGYGYSFFGNTGSRVALNNCTVKALNSGNGADPTYNFTSNGCDVVLKGGAVLANSCIWASGVVGQRGLASIAHNTTTGSIDDYAAVVNSVCQQTSNLRSALFVAANWYMKAWGSIYANLNRNGSAVEGTNFVFDNCYDRGLANATLPGAKGFDDIQKGETGITHSYYKYTFNASTWENFTPMTKSDVKDKVANTPYVGAIFDAWLTEIGAYDVDIMDNTRTDDNMCPGSYHQTWAN